MLLLNLNRQHDPSGKRTVGVVTKIDMTEPGIRDRLEATGADHLRLDLGYVAVGYHSMLQSSVGKLLCLSIGIP